MDNKFTIQNLNCSYKNKQVVLKIKDLVIPSGKLVFVLGVSGVGKSTFIETLGLMNRTILESEKTSVQFHVTKEQKTFELRDYWQKDNSVLSDFRSRYFSFIFQNTNLMPNFTAGENMCISQLMQGMTLAEAKDKVLETMATVRLPAEVFDKRIMDLSGGQRQRLAFVRAITADFEVLFGDEPTGNLDKDTAFRLMSMLKNGLDNRTAIIVSHDIELALAFADEIIVLTLSDDETKNEELYGEVLKKNIFTVKDHQLVNQKGEVIEAAEQVLYEKLKSAEFALGS